MNLCKSIEKALAEESKDNAWLADTIGKHVSQISRYRVLNNAPCKVLVKMAQAFNLKVSEFIALGET